MLAAQIPLGIPRPRAPSVERRVMRLRSIFFRWLDMKVEAAQDRTSERVKIVYS